jgi:hypothetical protein
MRFIAVGALSVSCALVGCAHNQSGSPESAPPPQPAEQQRPSHESKAGSAGTGAIASPSAQTPLPARPQSKTTPGSGSTSSTPSRSPSTSKEAGSQGGTSTKPKPPAAPRNAGNEAGAAPAAGAPKTEASRPATSSTSPAAPAAAKANPPPPAAAALDLTSLEQRLKDTRAIGVFTKLSLKNQVDDLLSQFRAFHNRKGSMALSELRQRYDLLLLKVLSLLQNGDPPLASAISGSREALWSILSDPQKFAKL